MQYAREGRKTVGESEQGIPVSDVDCVERNLKRQVSAQAFRKVVNNDRLVSICPQQINDMRADEAGTTGDQVREHES